MARFLGTAETLQPADEVFDFLADFSNVASWDPSVISAERRGRGRVRVGSRFDVSVGLGGVGVALDYRVVALERPRRVVFEAAGDGFTSVDTITVDEREDGRTRVTYDARIRLHGLRCAFEGPVQLAFWISGGRSLAGLRRALDADALPWTDGAPARGR